VSIPLPQPTQDVEALVRLIGPEATLKLVESRGGTRLYVSEAIEGMTIADIVGVDAARILASEYGRDRIKIPLARPWRVLCYRARGLSYRAIALRAGCTEGTVWDILTRHGATSSQLDLFGRSA
jgi:lambda repressor-like predicted transcriptional regulator